MILACAALVIPEERAEKKLANNAFGVVVEFFGSSSPHIDDGLASAWIPCVMRQ